MEKPGVGDYIYDLKHGERAQRTLSTVRAKVDIIKK
jgi:hypothetical protein